MPPKKPQSKGKSKGGKGKGKTKKEKKPKKMSRKEKKLRKKFKALKVEDQEGVEIFAYELRRDELEWQAEKAIEQVTLWRDERIRFQLERDYLYDIMQTYWKKYRCLMVEQEKKIADNNRMNQDADDLKTVKAIEGKHFRYESQLNCTAMDVRDELRKKKLKEMLENYWQKIALDMDELDDEMERNAAKYRVKVQETKEKLDDLQDYIDDHRRQLEEYVKNLEKEMEVSKALFDLTRRMEFQMIEERWSEYIWKMSRNFENMYKSMKNYYNDATHSNLTLIFTLQDWMNETIEKRNMYLQQISEYEQLMAHAHDQMPHLQKIYNRERVKHLFIVRTKQALKTTKKDITITLNTVNIHKGELRRLVYQFNSITAERDHLKNNCEEMIAKSVSSYHNKFGIKMLGVETRREIRGWMNEKKRLQGHFPTPEAYERSTRPYKNLLDRRDAHIEREKLKSIRIQKQCEDLRSAMEARLLNVGLERKHRTEPLGGFAFSRAQTRLDWGPANLVANKAYQIPPQAERKVWSPPPADETLIKVCPTESVRAFMAWKGKKREERLDMLRQMRETKDKDKRKCASFTAIQ